MTAETSPRAGTEPDARAAESPGQASGTDESLRFGFGRNWSQFIEQHFNEARVESSRQHLLGALRLDSLAGKSFLDIGCGSGLHSLAALRCGASQVTGFDYDQDSVATSLKVRELAAGGDPRWSVAQGSVLDRSRMEALGEFDIVYSWGVLHHTGDMWKAMDNALLPRRPDGVVYIALYSSDQYVDPPAEHWVRIKRRYNQHGAIGRRLMEWRHASRHFLSGLRRLEMPWTLVRSYGTRGMNFWTDIRDWLGGWPIEFASYCEVEGWAARHGLTIVNALVGEGCTEYILADPATNQQWGAEERRRRGSLAPLPGPFRRDEGHAWIAMLPKLLGSSDAERQVRGSTLMLYDGERPFGLPHFMRDHVVRFGRGRFVHWRDHVVFSTPDGSDPNADPARWRCCERY
jgi:SAM-dependent methyltransferase